MSTIIDNNLQYREKHHRQCQIMKIEFGLTDIVYDTYPSLNTFHHHVLKTNRFSTENLRQLNLAYVLLGSATNEQVHYIRENAFTTP